MQYKRPCMDDRHLQGQSYKSVMTVTVRTNEKCYEEDHSACYSLLTLQQRESRLGWMQLFLSLTHCHRARFQMLSTLNDVAGMAYHVLIHQWFGAHNAATACLVKMWSGVIQQNNASLGMSLFVSEKRAFSDQSTERNNTFVWGKGRRGWY